MIRLKRFIIFLAAVAAVSCQAGQLSGTDYAAMVDTRIGTKGSGLECGYTFLGATYPFGMARFRKTLKGKRCGDGFCRQARDDCGTYMGTGRKVPSG